MFSKYWLLLLASLLIGAGIGFFVNNESAVYQTEARIYVDKGLMVDRNGNGVYTEDEPRFWQSINGLTKTKRFEKKMSKKFKNYWKDSLTVDSNNGTNIVTLKYNSPSQQTSIRTARYALKTLKAELEKYSGQNLKITVIDQANKNTTQIVTTGSKKYNIAIGALLGLFVGFLISAFHLLIKRKKSSQHD